MSLSKWKRTTNSVIDWQEEFDYNEEGLLNSKKRIFYNINGDFSNVQ